MITECDTFAGNAQKYFKLWRLGSVQLRLSAKVLYMEKYWIWSDCSGIEVMKNNII